MVWTLVYTWHIPNQGKDGRRNKGLAGRTLIGKGERYHKGTYLREGYKYRYDTL